MESDEILRKLLNKEELSEEELGELAYEYPTVNVEVGENRRWSRAVSHVYEVEGRFFQLDWECGLTENQENQYWDQPYEVSHKQEKKMIEVVTNTYTKI